MQNYNYSSLLLLCWVTYALTSRMLNSSTFLGPGQERDLRRKTGQQVEPSQSIPPNSSSEGTTTTAPTAEQWVLQVAQQTRTLSFGWCCSVAITLVPLNSPLALPLYVTSFQAKLTSRYICLVKPEPRAYSLAAREAVTMSGFSRF